MGIQVKHDPFSVLVDHETFHRFSRGTPFQQSMNLLVIINQYLEEDQKEILAGFNLSPAQHQQALIKLEAVRKAFLKVNPPPDIDPDALRFFCD